MKTLVIRQAGIKDAKAVARIEKICFEDPWSEKSIAHDIEFNELTELILAVSGKEVLGYIDEQTVLDECDIRRVAVLPEYRRTGIGSIMLEALLDYTDSAGVVSHTLEVRESNTAARALYGKYGFQENGRRKDYYTNEDGTKEDAVLMLRIGDPEVIRGGMRS